MERLVAGAGFYRLPKTVERAEVGVVCVVFEDGSRPETCVVTVGGLLRV